MLLLRLPQALALILVLLSLAATARGQEQSASESSQRFAGYTVYYSVFPSTMVQPDIALLHQLTRSPDQMLVNIAVVADGVLGGQAAELAGVARNLLQQRRTLDFKAIVEGSVVYYLAPLRVTDEEIMHFDITVDPEGTAGPFQLNFSKKLHVDR